MKSAQMGSVLRIEALSVGIRRFHASWVKRVGGMERQDAAGGGRGRAERSQRGAAEIRCGPLRLGSPPSHEDSGPAPWVRTWHCLRQAWSEVKRVLDSVK